MLYRRKKGLSGFTLIELAIVLGITGILFTGLWRMLSNGNQQLRDQATASQQQQLINAVSIELASSEGQNTFLAPMGASTSKQLPLPTTGCPVAYTYQNFCAVLPPGFTATTVNPYGQTYQIYVLKDATPAGTPPQSWSFMIVTSTAAGGDAISDTDGGRISSMIGGDGGFVYSNNVCGSPTNTFACGAYGAWLQSIAAGNLYGVPTPATGGVVASRKFYSPTQNLTSPWLARLKMPGDSTYGYNTMSWDMYVNGVSPAAGTWVPFNVNLAPPGGAPLAAFPGSTGGNINMGSVALGDVPGSTGATADAPLATGGGVINMAGGSINFANAGALTGGNTGGAINLAGGTVNLVSPAAATTGGGAINLQGGVISDASSNQAINVNTGGVAYDNGGASEPQGFVSIGTNCSQDGVAGLGSGTADINCGPGLQVLGDEYVEGRLNANSLYAQTFIYGTPAPPSDIRLKKDIHPLDNPLDDIMKLKPVAFTYKSNGFKSMGVIAQDLEKVYPQLVVERGDDHTKAVVYDGLIGPLIGAVQELKKENDDLRDQLRLQAARQEKLEQELKTKQP